MCLGARLAVLLSPKQCDVDSVTSSMQQADDNDLLLPTAASLRLPPLLSLSSPLSAGVVDSPAVKHSVIVCVLSLLRTLLRVDNCIPISTTQEQVGRMVRTRTGGERKGRSWVGGKGDEGDQSSDDSDTDLDIQ